jgi:hypothetical protein
MLMLRTLIEERFLRRELAGYEAYTVNNLAMPPLNEPHVNPQFSAAHGGRK